MSKNNKKGMSLLYMVVILGAFALITVVSLSCLSINSIDMNFVHSRGQNALSLAEGCIYDALRRINLDNSSNLTDNIIVYDKGYCVVNIVRSGSNHSIDAQGILDDYNAKVEVYTELNSGNLNILDWDEVAVF